MKNRSKILKNSEYHWSGVEKKDYKTQGTNFKDISRYSLLGEADDEWELNFQTRYFEIQPGGYSSLEYHRHPHSVVIIRGCGSMVLGDEIHELGLHDVVFISPETLHQFHADKGEPLGFICVVDRYRDKPAVPDETFLDNRLGESETRKKCRI
jgi:mannose-6-phosphate isomerase-like protein (cupin superfamily)